MNFNEFVLSRTKNKCKKKTSKGKSRSVIGSKTTMGPPTKAPRRKKESTTTSSELNWGKSHISVPNTPSFHKTMSSSKSSTVESESRIVIAVTEGRGEARCEVGIAAINISRPHLVLCQISDTQSYINTLTKINIFNPHEIIMPQTFVDNLTSENRLIDIIKKQFPKIKYTSVARSIFNKTNGIEILKQLCIGSSSPILLALQHRYYALSAASALLTYAQENLYIYYSSSTIKLDYQESEGYAIIDVSTADRLELVCSARPAQANKYSSLFGILNNCLTKIGSRNLRSVILQPLCLVEKIEERLQCVSELYLHPQTLISVQAILQKIPNIDMLLTLATIVPNDPQRCSTRQLNYVLLLNSLIDLVAPLKEVLKTCSQPFYRRFHELLEGEELASIGETMRKVVQEDAYPGKGPAADLQRIFAIKAGVNGLLDLVRKTYSERIEDMREYVKKLGVKYDLALTLGNNNTKGYHIVLNLNQQQKRFMKKSDLPEEFIQVYRLAGSFTMKTPELVNLSTRIDDVMEDIFKISNVMIHSIIIDMKNYMDFFYKLCENIAYLDVLQSLAETSRQNNYVRPKFGEYTELVHCYHPILDYLCSTKITSNPIRSSKEFNVHVVTGPNGSGKSVYIRQVALVQVMAQVGCFVPASAAILRPADRIYARVYLEDDMEADASSFVLEIRELKYIMATMTENSLILMDEPCRSTSLEEGTALALAICEKFALSSAFLYVTTHFTLITKLYDMYLNIKIWQMETVVTGDNPKNLKLDYKYNILPGVTSVKMYGVHLVRNIWPVGLLKHVYDTLESFSSNKNPIIIAQDKRLRLKYDLQNKFQQLKSQKSLTISEINRNLQEYQAELEELGEPIEQLVIDENDLPGLCHPIFEAASDEPLQNQNISEAYIGEEYFSEQQQEEFAATTKSHQMIHQRMQTLFTPDDSQHLSQSSNYENISNFLNEDSGNIEKLIPDLRLDYSENSSQSLEGVPENAFGLFGLDHKPSKSDVSLEMSDTVRQMYIDASSIKNTESQRTVPQNFVDYEISNQMSEIVRQKFSKDVVTRCRQPSPRHNLFDNDGAYSKLYNNHSQNIFTLPNLTRTQPFQVKDVQQSPKNSLNPRSFHSSTSNSYNSSSDLQKISSIDLSQNMNDFKFCLPLHRDGTKTSTPVILNNINTQNQKAIILNDIGDIDLESIQDELTECSRLLEEDNGFSEDSEVLDVDVMKDSHNKIPNNTISLSSSQRSEESNDTLREQPNRYSQNKTPNQIDNNTSSQYIQYTSLEEDPCFLDNCFQKSLQNTSSHLEPASQHETSYKIKNAQHNIIEKPKSQYSHYISPKVSIIEGSNDKTQSFGDENDTSCEDQLLEVTHHLPLNIDSGVLLAKATGDEGQTELSNECLPLTNSQKVKEDQQELSCNKIVGEDTLSYSPLASPPSVGSKRVLYYENSSNEPKKVFKQADTSSSKDNIGQDQDKPLEDSFSKMQISVPIKGNNWSIDNDKTLLSCQQSSVYESPCSEIVSSQQNVLAFENYVTADECNSKIESSFGESFKSSKSNSHDPENSKPGHTTTSGISSASKKRNLDQVTTSSNDKSDTSLSSASRKRNIEVSNSAENMPASTSCEDRKSQGSTSSHKESDEKQPKKRKRLGYLQKVSATQHPKTSQCSSSDSSAGKKKIKRFSEQVFLAPEKLTVREIRQEFMEQDRKLFESTSGDSDISKYLDMVRNRPTAYQVKASTYLATYRKTSDGVEVIPAKKSKRKRSLKTQRCFSEESIDVSIFSDKNAKPFEEFLKSDEKDYKTFNFNFTKNQETIQKESGLFQALSPCEQSYDGVKMFSTNFVRTKSIDIFNSQESVKAQKADDTLTPDGYFKENRTEIEKIVQKFVKHTSCE